jgi:hypothetical protein
MAAPGKSLRVVFGLSVGFGWFVCGALLSDATAGFLIASACVRFGGLTCGVGAADVFRVDDDADVSIAGGVTGVGGCGADARGAVSDMPASVSTFGTVAAAGVDPVACPQNGQKLTVPKSRLSHWIQFFTSFSY